MSVVAGWQDLRPVFAGLLMLGLLTDFTTSKLASPGRSAAGPAHRPARPATGC